MLKRREGNTSNCGMSRKLTEGSVFKNIIFFSLPFLLSYFMQTLYSLADLFIIGQFSGVESTTAVSIGGQVMHMITVMIVGLAMGSSVLVGRSVGAEDKEMKNKAIGNTVMIFTIVSVALALVLVICSSGVVSIMQTPVEAISGTRSYLIVCFIGIPFITAYNVISSVFRGMGDSKSPMYFIAVACVCNIVLDCVFIGLLGLGAMGAAMGTTLSQVVSVVVALVYSRKYHIVDGLGKSDFIPDKEVVRSIFKVGLPISAQDGFIQISFLLITVFANRRGLTDAAAVGIVEKLIGILFLVPSSLLSSVSTLCAQNIGAGKEERAEATLKYAIALAAGIGLVFAICFQFCSVAAVGLFTSDSAVVISGEKYMKSYVWDCVAAGVHFVFSGYFCACNRSGISFLHNTISIITARIPIAYFASVYYKTSLYPMGLGAPIGSCVSVIVCVVAYVYIHKKEKITT